MCMIINGISIYAISNETITKPFTILKKCFFPKSEPYTLPQR